MRNYSILFKKERGMEYVMIQLIDIAKAEGAHTEYI
jgi:hypothetical protein